MSTVTPRVVPSSGGRLGKQTCQLEGGTGFIFKPVLGSKKRYKNRLTVNDEASLV